MSDYVILKFISFELSFAGTGKLRGWCSDVSFRGSWLAALLGNCPDGGGIVCQQFVWAHAAHLVQRQVLHVWPGLA